MPKVFFINRFFYPDHSATSQLLSDLCFFLADSGFDVHVITSRQRYEDPDAELPAQEVIRGVTVHRVWTSRFGRQKLHLRALDYLTFYLSAAWVCVLRLAPKDIVVAKTDPPMISVVAWAAARLKGARLVNWLQDLYPEVALALGMHRLRPFAGFLEAIRNLSLRGAQLNVVIGNSMGQRLGAERVTVGRIQVIHNWADGAAIVPCDRESNPLREAWGLVGKFVVGYSGNMGRVHEFETILGSIDRFRTRSDICFLFIGSGAQRQWLEERVATRGWTNVSFKRHTHRLVLAPDSGLALALTKLMLVR